MTSARYRWSALGAILLGLAVVGVAVSCGMPVFTCDAATCGGCCDNNGRCLSGATIDACGIGAAACARCTGQDICWAATGSCAPASDAGAPGTDAGTPGTDAGQPADGGSAADAGAGNNGNGACAGMAAGTYCGNRLGLTAADLYRCNGGLSATLLSACAEGCNAGTGTSDQCYQGSCSGLGSGEYCGGDKVGGNPTLLYDCTSNTVASFGYCPNGCSTQSSTVNDYCYRASTSAPTKVVAAAANGSAWVQWTGTALNSFTITSFPPTQAVVVPATAQMAQFPGLTNGTTYTFNVTADGAATSLPSNAATPATTANIIPDVPERPQQQALTCEEASLSMALMHEGINQTETAILNDIGVDYTASSVSNNVLTWGNPYLKFVGDPAGSEVSMTGYGTYYPNIVRAATDFGGTVIASGEGLLASDLYSALLAGHPVVAWVAYDWAYHAPQMDWDYYATGQKVATWNGPVEHAIVLVGVTANSVIVNNPAHKTPWDVVSRATFETAWSTYNNMAVILQ